MNDKTIILNTKEGYSEFETERITGEVIALIIKVDPNKMVDIIIESENGYTILNKRECIGNMYLPITTRKLDEMGHGLMDGVCFYLNEALKIKLNGDKNIQVSMIFRIN